MALWSALILILVVGLVGPLLGAWLLVKNTEKAEKDPRYRRNFLLFAAGLYTLAFIASGVDLIGRAHRHELEWTSLIGLAVGATIITFFFKAAFGKASRQ